MLEQPLDRGERVVDEQRRKRFGAVAAPQDGPRQLPRSIVARNVVEIDQFTQKGVPRVVVTAGTT